MFVEASLTALSSNLTKLKYFARYRHVFFQKLPMYTPPTLPPPPPPAVTNGTEESVVQPTASNGGNEQSATVLSKSALRNKLKLELKDQRRANLKKRRQERQAVKPVGTSNESLDQTEYYFENGLRKVYP